MLCTFELNIILQNRTTFEKSLQGRTRCRSHPPVHCSTYLITCGSSQFWVCLLFFLLALYSEQELFIFFLCLSLYSVESLHLDQFDYFLSESKLKDLFSGHISVLLGCEVKLVTCSMALYLCLRYKKGSQVLEEHSFVPNCHLIFFKGPNNIPLIATISKLLESLHVIFQPHWISFKVCPPMSASQTSETVLKQKSLKTF